MFLKDNLYVLLRLLMILFLTILAREALLITLRLIVCLYLMVLFLPMLFEELYPYPPFSPLSPFFLCFVFYFVFWLMFYLHVFYYRFCFLFITPWGWIENLLMPFKVTILPLFISLFEYFVFLYFCISNKFYHDSVLWCLFVYVVMLFVMLLQVLHVDYIYGLYIPESANRLPIFLVSSC